MKCPYCGADNDRVIDSRASDDRFSIRRRRECLDCKHRYTTHERIEELQVKVVKKDGCRDPFDPEKIRRGLEKACWKRPISSESTGDHASKALGSMELIPLASGWRPSRISAKWAFTPSEKACKISATSPSASAH
jgi:transcriptional repressor NrdR